MRIPNCFECNFFKEERCRLTNKKRRKIDQCELHYSELSAQQASKILHDYQCWRRGGRNPMLLPYVVGIAIDSAIKQLRTKR